jgi:hypothetical protein
VIILISTQVLTQAVLPLSESNITEVNRGSITKQHKEQYFDDILQLSSLYLF